MKTYDWANNSIKLRRILDKLGEDTSEEEIKAEYIREGGLLNIAEVGVLDDEQVVEYVNAKEVNHPKKTKKVTKPKVIKKEKLVKKVAKKKKFAKKKKKAKKSKKPVKKTAKRG